MLETARKLLALGLEATRMRDDFEAFWPEKGRSFRNWLCLAAPPTKLGSGYGGLEERERCERQQRCREDFDFRKRKIKRPNLSSLTLSLLNLHSHTPHNTVVTELHRSSLHHHAVASPSTPGLLIYIWYFTSDSREFV